MKINSIFFIIFFFGSVMIFPQRENHDWKPLIVEEKQKIWYDANQIDTVTTSPFDVWILELHRPVLKLEQISDNIMRTKTLYTVNLKANAFGLKEAVYYDPANKEIKRFSYDLLKYSEEQKYIFPITPNSFMEKLVGILVKRSKLRTGS